MYCINPCIKDHFFKHIFIKLTLHIVESSSKSSSHIPNVVSIEYKYKFQSSANADNSIKYSIFAQHINVKCFSKNIYYIPNIYNNDFELSTGQLRHKKYRNTPDTFMSSYLLVIYLPFAIFKLQTVFRKCFNK